MKILLTGARGNLGSSLQRQGGSHHQFFSIDREDWTGLERKVDQADLILHAASDLVTPFAKDPEKVIDSNVLTTVRLLKAWEKNPSARFVFISSCAVYGRSEITREDVEPTPLSINGISKLLNEKMIGEFAPSIKGEAQIFRIFNTFGGSDQFSIIHHLSKSVENRKPFTLFNNGVSQRDFIHVDDVASIVLKLIEKPVAHKVLNIGSGEAVKIKDIVEEFRKKNPKLETVNAAREEAEYSRADISRLQSLLPDFRFRSVLDFLRTSF